MARGPMSVADFMSQALQHPKHGYYTAKKHVIGKKGDFTTSPEISQLFGELVGVWCVTIWEQLGKPPRIGVIEMGGGRGALIKDVVRTFASFPAFAASLSGIALVETSDAMRGLQAEALRAHDGFTRVGGARVGVRWSPALSEAWSASSLREPVVVIAQELFDALPVHQFERTERGWCERLVTVGAAAEPDLDGLHHHLHFALSPGPTPAARLLLGDAPAEIGARVEVGAVAAALSQELSAGIAQRGGAALIVDYGSDGDVADSLRGIREHRFVHPLREPGFVDLSVDVNFADVRAAAQSAGPPFARAVGPVPQASFLRAMGIEHRVAALLRQPHASEAQKLAVFRGYKRLVEDMGASYHVMALASLPDPFAKLAGLEP